MKLAVVIFAAFKLWTATGVNTVGPIHLTVADQIERMWSTNEDGIKQQLAEGNYDEVYGLAQSNVVLAAQYAPRSDMLATSLEELGIAESKLGSHQKSAECFALSLETAKYLKHWPESNIVRLEETLKREQEALHDSPSEKKPLESPLALIDLGRNTSLDPANLKNNFDVHTLGLQADLAFKTGSLRKAKALFIKHCRWSFHLSPVKNEELAKSGMRGRTIALIFGDAAGASESCDFTDYLTSSYLPDNDPIRIRTCLDRALADCEGKKFLPAQDFLKGLHEKQKNAFENDEQLEGLYNLVMGWACFGESYYAGKTWLQPALEHANKAIELLQAHYQSAMDYAQALRLSGLVLERTKDSGAVERMRLALSVASSDLSPNHPYLAKFYRDYANVLLENKEASKDPKDFAKKALVNARTGLALAQKLYAERQPRIHGVRICPELDEIRAKRLGNYKGTLESSLRGTPLAEQTELEI